MDEKYFMIFYHKLKTFIFLQILKSNIFFVIHLQFDSNLQQIPLYNLSLDFNHLNEVILV